MKVENTTKLDDTHVVLDVLMEDGEDSQYPLEDLLDEFNVWCDDFVETDSPLVNICLCLDEAKPGTLEKLLDLKGKRVYDVEDEDCIKLKIE